MKKLILAGATLSFLTFVLLFTHRTPPAPQTALAQSSCTHNASSQSQIDSFIANAQPGQTLCIADGTYTAIHTPSSFAGTASQPITIRAVNEGKVLIDAGDDRAISVEGSYGIVEGINAKGGSNGGAIATRGSHWILRRVIGWVDNPDSSAIIISVGGDPNVVEDCAAFGYSRKTIQAGTDTPGPRFNTLRRCWARYEGRGGTESPGNIIEMGYQQDRVLFENVLATKNLNPGAGNANPDSPFIAFNTEDSAWYGSVTYQTATDNEGAAGLVVWNNGNETQRTIFKDIVSVQSPDAPNYPNSGFYIDGNTNDGNSVANLIAIGGSDQRCASSYAGCPGELRTEPTREAMEARLGQSVWTAVPGICHRYINGQLTNQPLWPWPMNERIKDALQQSGRTPVDITATMESLLGPIPQECKGSGGSTPTPTPTPQPPADTLCSKVDQAYALPQGFGSPYNFFTSPSIRTLNAYCNYTNAANPIVTAFVSKPSSIQYHYTYLTGYQWHSTAAQWEPFTFTCDGSLVAGVWCTSSARKQLNYAQPYFIAYSCSWINNSWKCGCRDSQCATGYWQLQRFE